MFKEQFGVNFVDYLAQIRINKAKEYLSTTTKSFLVNNLVYVALGYVDDFTNNFGLALNKIDDTKLYNNIYELVVKN